MNVWKVKFTKSHFNNQWFSKTVPNMKPFFIEITKNNQFFLYNNIESNNNKVTRLILNIIKNRRLPWVTYTYRYIYVALRSYKESICLLWQIIISTDC